MIWILFHILLWPTLSGYVNKRIRLLPRVSKYIDNSIEGKTAATENMLMF